CGQLKLRTGGDLVLQPLVEAHALLPLERVSHVGVVGGHESLNVLSGDGGIREVARRRHLRLNIETQTSIKLNQDACTGRKWKTNVRCGWAASQLTTSADQCELTGSRIRWIGWPTGVCSSSKASSSQNSRERCFRRTMPHTWPSLTRKPASRSTVPLRLYSNSRRAGRGRAGGRRGTGGWS